MTSALLLLADSLPEAAALGVPSIAAAAPLGLVLYLYLLAPYVLLDYLRLFYNVLADAHLFLEDRALLHHNLFLGYRHHDLVFSDLGLRGPALSGLALTGACDELFFGSLHPELILVLKVVASTLVYALIMGGVLAELAGFGVAHGHPGTHGASVGALI